MTFRQVLGKGFRASVSRARLKSGDERSRALFATLRAICGASSLPGPADDRVVVPPVRTGFVRRVRGYNLWVHYSVRDDAVIFVLVVTQPPVPAYGDD